MQNILRKQPAILLTFVKLHFVFQNSVLSIFESLLKTGFTVINCIDSQYLPSS